MKIDVPKMAKGVSEAAVKSAAAFFEGRQVLADSSTKEKRLHICSKCPYLVDGQCQECLCLVRAKAILAEESCPKQLW